MLSCFDSAEALLSMLAILLLIALMHYSSRKERIIRIASHFFVRRGRLTENRVESILRDGFNDVVWNDPTITIDHIRVGLVEFGLLLRDPDGGAYRISLWLGRPAFIASTLNRSNEYTYRLS